MTTGFHDMKLRRRLTVWYIYNPSGRWWCSCLAMFTGQSSTPRGCRPPASGGPVRCRIHTYLQYLHISTVYKVSTVSLLSILSTYLQVLYEVTASGVPQNWPGFWLNSNRLRDRTADTRGDGVYNR